MKIIIISSSSSIENEASIITQLFEAGLETFHLRKHRLSKKDTDKIIDAIPTHFHNRIVIHTHHRLASKYKLKGIHLTKSHIKKKFRTWWTLKLIKLKNPNFIMTTSFNNIGQLMEKHDFDYSYVFLSPMFDSLHSKFQGGFTAHSLKSAIEKSLYKVIARGGVDINAIEKSKHIGVDGLAFYSYIWKHPSPVAEFNKIVEKFEELNIPIE